MNMISTYFSWQEVTHSETAERKGIDNMLPEHLKEAAIRTALRMDAVRKLLNRPVIVSSWYRSPALNTAIGGSKTSSHTKGEAVDFICPQFGSAFKIAQFLEANVDVLQFDQLIYEGTWVHISFTSKPRKQVLTWLGGATYVSGIKEIRK